MKVPFPHKLQYAMNLTNNSQEAIDRINQWANEKGGNVEHMSTEDIRAEVLPTQEVGGLMLNTDIMDPNTGDDNMTDGLLSLGDIPDFSGISDSEGQSDPFINGWYRGQIVAKREFTDKNGNERVFESGDSLSKAGDSRNLTLQVMLTRKDGKTLNVKTSVNYRPEDISQETVQAVQAKIAEHKGSSEKTQWGTLFRSYMTLMRLGQLQKIAGVRQFQRDAETGGLDVSSAYGKTAFFRIKDDSRNPLYKEVDKFQPNEPKKVAVL